MIRAARSSDCRACASEALVSAGRSVPNDGQQVLSLEPLRAEARDEGTAPRPKLKFIRIRRIFNVGLVGGM
jgi:hypothetical protein